MRVGILGGTFDPIHLGHLRAAENAREALGLDRVLLVPASVPPHRPEPASSALDRFAMVALAASGHPAFAPCDLELRRQGPSFTVDTLAALRESSPDDALVLIVGSDTYPEMAAWRERERLLGMCTLAVVDRPGEEPPALAPGVRRVEAPGLPVSASDVRRRVREGRSVRYLVPDGVADYLGKRGLYR